MKLKQEPALEKFNCLYREMDGIYHNLSLKTGLSDSAFAILYAFGDLGDGCLQKDIAQYSSISKQTINSSIKKLEQEGFLIRRRGKGRDMHLFLTPAGQNLLLEKIGPVFEMENSIFSEMDPTECAQLLRLTQKYVDLYREKTGQMPQEKTGIRENSRED